jgi:hypothetical protein
VLNTSSYREAARRVQGTLVSAPGAAGGADELERLAAPRMRDGRRAVGGS